MSRQLLGRECAHSALEARKSGQWRRNDDVGRVTDQMNGRGLRRQQMRGADRGKHRRSHGKRQRQNRYERSL